MTKPVGTDNAVFWDRRYRDLPALGSGPGSRGYAVFVKRRIVRDVIRRYAPATVLDVGCGDMSLVDENLFAGIAYVGVDISSVIVERNALRFPGYTFVLRDIAGEPLGLRADLVLSFDVLIHQLTRAAFDAALGRILDAIDVAGVIGYSTPPLPDGTAPDYVPDGLAGEELEHELALQRILEQTQGVRMGMGTAYYGPFETLVAAVRPAMRVVPIAVYRDNTAYLVLPG